MQWYPNNYKRAKMKDLLGKTITKIKGKQGDNELTFTCSDGSVYKMYHEQDCCEHVYLEDVAGDLEDLVGSPIVDAREETNCEEHPPGVFEDSTYHEDSFTWTFYILSTLKGSVTLRWYGESNGYYGEGVDFVRIDR